MTEIKTIQGEALVRRLGRLSAWSMLVICAIYAAVLLAGGVVRGLPREPWFALAEVLTILSAIILVVLMGAIHACTSPPYRLFSLLGLGWMFVLAGITITVHMAELTVVRQLDHEDQSTFARLFEFEWPSLLYGVEFVAWHIGFGLSTFFTAFAFQGAGREKAIRLGLIVVSLLCLAGLIGPAVGNLNWRLIGVFGYVIVFPGICIMIAQVFNDAAPD